MNRFYSNGELFVDLDEVSCVAFESVVVGGVSVKVSEAVAFDLRRQVRAYKESRDRKQDNFESVVTDGFLRVIWWCAVNKGRLRRGKKEPGKEEKI